jgi:hypothetical protein
MLVDLLIYIQAVKNLNPILNHLIKVLNLKLRLILRQINDFRIKIENINKIRIQNSLIENIIKIKH